ncbi:MAG TPA: hypothetical protein VNO70_18275, partial [Blastocatellia bacterium]|nr:hypothetical protein [Blastocatellia bacterium]
DFDMVEQPFAEQTASALENADEAEFPTPAMWGSAPEAEAPPPGEPEVGFDFVPVAPSQPEETQEQAAAPPQEATAGAEGSRPVELSEAVIEEIVRRVMARMTDEVVREIAWEVVPECVERVIKEQTRHALTK